MKTSEHHKSSETETSRAFPGQEKNGNTFFQPKLTVGPADDKYEREADDVADKVIQMKEAYVQPKLALQVIQPKCKHCEDEEKLQRKENSSYEAMGEAPSIVSDAIASGGSPMEENTRTFMESRFGYDFSNVKIHQDAIAAKSAHAINALAYTSGNSIVFNEGQYSPGTDNGKRLLAHELAHVVQQNSALSLKPIQRSPFNRDTLHDPLLDQFSADTGAPRDTASQHSPEYENWLYNTTHQGVQFIPPTPVAENPLVRLGRGLQPGGTRPTINGLVMSDVNDVQNQITPTAVEPTGITGGNVTCRIPRSLVINTSANVIVANNPGVAGWTANVPPDKLGNPPQCAGVAAVPTTMNALPSNADFVTRVRNSEQEHVDAINELHEKHFVPYHRFLMSLTAQGSSGNDCANNIVAQLNNRHMQAAYGFQLGYAAETERLDSAVGTHMDTAVPTVAADCSSATLTISQTNAAIPGASRGNVIPVIPTQIVFNPATLTISGNTLMNGTTSIKVFSNNADATEALRIIRHYGMNTRNTIGSFEYFLVNGSAPTGALAGINEFAIDPEYYQVAFGLSGPNDWAIADVAGNRINTIWNFSVSRDQAYSAIEVMRRHRFTQRCWIGGTRLAPSMLYFRK